MPVNGAESSETPGAKTLGSENSMVRKFLLAQFTYLYKANNIFAIRALEKYILLIITARIQLLGPPRTILFIH